MPEVSIIMPVHNGQQFLAESINSILAQTYSDWEFVIVNDGSTDQTAAIIREFGDADCRIRYLEHSEQRGLAESLNTALSAVTGNMIARQDADDLSDPDRLNRMVQFLKENPLTGLVGTNGHYIDSGGEVVGSSDFPTTHDAIRASIMNGESPFFHGSWMFRKECIEKVGLYNKLLFSGEDKDLWLRVGEQYKTCILPEKLYYYRVHREAFTTQFSYPRKVMRELVLTLARERQDSGRDSLGLSYGGYLDQSKIPTTFRAASRHLIDASICLQHSKYLESSGNLISAFITGFRLPLVRKLVYFVLGIYMRFIRKRIRYFV